MANTLTLQHLLYKEFLSHIDASESTAQVTLPDGYAYYSRKESGAEYRLHCRRPIEGPPEEQVYLNENDLVDPANPNFFHCGFIRHSPCGRYVCFGIDTSGNERFVGRFIQLQKGFAILPDTIHDMHIDVEFSRCGSYVYYLEIGEAERAYKVFRKKIDSSDPPQ